MLVAVDLETAPVVVLARDVLPVVVTREVAAEDPREVDAVTAMEVTLEVAVDLPVEVDNAATVEDPEDEADAPADEEDGW